MGKTKKGEETRARILEAALALFRKNGVESTGMRDVAEAAALSLGSAYYYFPSKDHLVQGLYARTHDDHVAVLAPHLEKTRKLEKRLHLALTTKIESAEPYHAFSSHIFRSAADPKSPLNPFSSASRPVRDDAIDLMRQVVEGSDAKLPKDLRSDLPELLWLYEMAIILFWIHDASPGRRKTLRLIEHTVKIVIRLIQVASLPLLRPIRRQTRLLLAELRNPDESERPESTPC